MGWCYVTTPIYYVNDLPHIGHIYTTVVADTLARYRRPAGDDMRFPTGTDEHGQNIERAAAREGVRPIELADRVVSRDHQWWRSWGSRTTTSSAPPSRATSPGWRRSSAASTPPATCTPTGTRWHCSSCANFYTEKELLAGNRCPVHEQPVEWHSEENVFFRLSRYQQPLLTSTRTTPFVRPETRRNEVRSFVASGLRDLSVSRAGLDWGVPFPGRPGQTVYVWLDALTNYISALGFGGGGGGDAGDDADYRRFWAASEAERFHLVGKDILRFHAVYWPAFLLSAGLPLPTTVWAHGWWLRDQKKISKSVGNVVRPDQLVATFGGDALRYFLLREMIFGQDASFSDEGFVDRYNSDLANDLGNTASRVVTLARRAFDGKTPPVACDDNPLIAAARRAVEGYHAAMGELAFQRALESLWRLLAETNGYLVEREPWKLIKTEGASERLARILWNGLEAVRIVATGLLPFMPRVAPQVLAAVGSPVPATSFAGAGGIGGGAGMAWGGTPTSAPLPEPAPLFPRIDKEAYFAEAAPAAADRRRRLAPKPAAPRRGGTRERDRDDRHREVLRDRAEGGHRHRRRAGAEVEQAGPAHRRPRRREPAGGGRYRQAVPARGAGGPAGGGGGQPPAGDADGRGVPWHGARRVGGRRPGAAPAREARPRRHPGQVTAPRGGSGAAGPWQQTEDRVGAPLSPLRVGEGLGE